MAEAIDRPAGSEQEGLGIPPGPPAEEVYRPLSLVALAGFGLAVLYVAVLGVCSLVALFNRAPLLLPLVLFLVPLAAAVTSWVGRNQILASEGTRTGLGFASWGMGLSLVCGLLYACYYAGTYFAVRQQSTALAEQWMDLLRKGDQARAYRLTIMPAVRPPDDAGLRDTLEVEYNAERGGRVTWNHFRQSELVALFRQGGQEVRAEPLGIVEWDYDKGSYRVMLRYRITAPTLSGEAQVALAGSRAPAGEYEGREWQVLGDATHLLPDSVKMTPEGEKRLRTAMTARAFADNWARTLFQGQGKDIDALWRDTLPADRREHAKILPGSEACSFPALSGTAPLGAIQPADRDDLLGLLAFRAGSLVHEDPQMPRKNAESTVRMVQAVRQLFTPGPRHRVGRLSLSTSRLPVLEESDGVVRVPLSGSILMHDEAGTMPVFNVEVVLRLESDAASAAGPQPLWRVVSLDLINARDAPARPAPGGGGRPSTPPQGGPPRPQ